METQQQPSELQPDRSLRQRVYSVIFESDTPAGRTFDVVLIGTIILSIVVVCLDSIAEMRARYGALLIAFEWVLTFLFTAEYILRLYAARRPLAYATSFFGVVDLISIIPTYISLLVPGAHYLLVVRILRLLRIFRVLKLAEYLHEAAVLRRALRASQQKISVFLLTVLTIVVIVGALMYVVEGEAGGFTNIPMGIYWAIVTLTTVGFGDITPVTPLGRALAAVVMLLGYGIIAVPTGIVTSELARVAQTTRELRACPVCDATGHDRDAHFCKYCGEEL